MLQEDFLGDEDSLFLLDTLLPHGDLQQSTAQDPSFLQEHRAYYYLQFVYVYE